jgi:hypothetical protein
VTELSEYVLETLWQGGEFVLYRGRQPGIARRPMPPNERVNRVPDPVPAIVLRLLAKSPRTATRPPPASRPTCGRA